MQPARHRTPQLAALLQRLDAALASDSPPP